LNVGVVKREFGEGRRFGDAHAIWGKTLQRIHDNAVVGTFAQTAAYADDVE
jgi:hypothetical protein